MTQIKDPDDKDTIVIRPPRGTKGRWVRLSRKKSQKLTDFVVHHVERSIALSGPPKSETSLYHTEDKHD